ncbi:MAG: radical SAM protein [archaeon]
MIKKIIWLIKIGLKNLKIKFYSFANKNISDPYRLLIKVNSKCNYSCVTCGLGGQDSVSFISKKNQEKIIDKYSNKLFFLSLTGGEPFLEEEKLRNFVIRIKEENPNLKYISINTNGSLPEKIDKFTKNLLNKFEDINLYIGLHYIPNQKWGKNKTGIENAYSNYKKSEKICSQIKNRFKNRFSFYKMMTISRKEDINFIKSENNLWINFAVIAEFYKNEKNKYIQKLNKEEKIKIINKFLAINKDNLSFLNKKFTLNLKKIIKSGKRKRECFAGVNRVYINEKGDEFICTRNLKSRKDMSKVKCGSCWTACEINFDFLPYFFLPPIINGQKKNLN